MEVDQVEVVHRERVYNPSDSCRTTSFLLCPSIRRTTRITNIQAGASRRMVTQLSFQDIKVPAPGFGYVPLHLPRYR